MRIDRIPVATDQFRKSLLIPAPDPFLQIGTIPGFSYILFFVSQLN